MFDLQKIVRPNILAMAPYASARDEFSGSKGIFLDANENPFGTLNRYPDPYQKELKETLAAVKKVSPQNIFLGNGSDEAIDLCYRIFCEPGKDKALTFTPTYGMYKVLASVNNVALTGIPLNDDFQIDLGEALPLLKDERLKLVFLCSPNNPTGNTLNALETIIQNFAGMVVVDEAYADFSDFSLLEKLEKYPNLIVLQTFSKAWGLAGARVGMAFASPAVISLFNKVKPPYNISKLNYTAVLTALINTDDYAAQKAEVIHERKKMAAALSSLPIVQKVYPSEANFLLVKVTDADAVYNTLLSQNIIVRNRGKEVSNCLRITIGNPGENAALLAALKNISI